MTIKYNTVIKDRPEQKIYRADVLLGSLSDDHPLQEGLFGDGLQVVTLVNADGRIPCVRVK